MQSHSYVIRVTLILLALIGACTERPTGPSSVPAATAMVTRTNNRN
ncbi:MAG TPA: hypothetical protein VGH98_23560 [Gemmatimonadaceae bacterium]|jgi:hypothetical protein